VVPLEKSRRLFHFSFANYDTDEAFNLLSQQSGMRPSCFIVFRQIHTFLLIFTDQGHPFLLFATQLLDSCNNSSDNMQL
jgi:hypothetical protein